MVAAAAESRRSQPRSTIIRPCLFVCSPRFFHSHAEPRRNNCRAVTLRTLCRHLSFWLRFPAEPPRSSGIRSCNLLTNSSRNSDAGGRNKPRRPRNVPEKLPDTPWDAPVPTTLDVCLFFLWSANAARELTRRTEGGNVRGERARGRSFSGISRLNPRDRCLGVVLMMLPQKVSQRRLGNAPNTHV